MPLAAMIGRERELTAVARVLGRSRMTTLTGPGGSGKTRLALELATGLHRDFEHGASFVDLSALSEERFVPGVVASALGLLLGERADPVDVVTEQLGRQMVLIVLDNCEHLLRGCARLASAILASCPNVVLLATSREPLRVRGEVVYRVPSLELPPAGVNGADDVEAVASVASVRLFTERATEAGSGFRFGPENCASVAALCRRLDGIPLALELAAARTTLLAPSEIVARLDDALDVLGPGAANETRHETLRATLAWSHDLLTDDERVLFRRVSAFAGTFDLVAAEDVCSAAPLTPHRIVALLGRLVDRSLVIVEASPVGTRYRLLETVRQFAREFLNASGESRSVASAHCAHYRRLAQAHDPEHATTPLLEEPSVLDREHDNFRAALRWSLHAEPTSALALASSLWRYWFLRCDVAEGAEWVERALDAAPEQTAERAQALIGLTGLDARRGRSDRIRHQAAAAVEIAVDLGDRVTALRHGIVHAVLVWATFEVTEAERVAVPLEREARALERPDLHAATTWVRAHFALTREVEAGARAMLSRCHAELEAVSADVPPFLPVVTPCIALVQVAGRVVPTYEESLIVGRRVGARQGVAYALSAQGYAFRLGGDLDSARDVVEQAVQRFATLGDDAGRAQALNHLGCVLRDAGEYDEADLRLVEAWELRRRSGDRRGEWMTTGSRALLAALRGDEDEAHAGAMRALVAFEAVGDRPSVANAQAGLGNDRARRRAGRPGPCALSTRRRRVRRAVLAPGRGLAPGRARGAVGRAGRPATCRDRGGTSGGALPATAVLTGCPTGAGRPDDARGMSTHAAGEPGCSS